MPPSRALEDPRSAHAAADSHFSALAGPHPRSLAPRAFALGAGRGAVSFLKP